MSVIEIGGKQFDASQFPCQACTSTRVTADYYDEENINGIETVTLGVKCLDCGETSLHISY